MLPRRCYNSSNHAVELLPCPLTSSHGCGLWKQRRNRFSICPSASGWGDTMWFLDFSTLVLIIAVGMQLGLQALFGWDLAGTIAGNWAPDVFMAMGLSSVSQLFRQKFQ